MVLRRFRGRSLVVGYSRKIFVDGVVGLPFLARRSLVGVRFISFLLLWHFDHVTIAQPEIGGRICRWLPRLKTSSRFVW